MKCYNCSTPLADDAKFCPLCGARNDGHANFCSNCGKPVDPDSQFCAECGAPVKKIKKEEEEKADLSTSMADIAMEITEKVLEKVEGDNHSTHFEEIQKATPSQIESPARSEMPAKPQTSTHDGSAGGAGQKIKRNAASVREAAAKQAQTEESTASTPVEMAQSPVEAAAPVAEQAAPQTECAPIAEQASQQTECAPVTEQNYQQNTQAPASRRSAAPVTKAAPAQTSAPVQAPAPVQTSAPTYHTPVGHVPVAEKIADKVIDTTKEVVKEGAKKLSVGKTVAIWAAVVAFLIGAATACLNFFVAPPEDTVYELVESVEGLDYEKLLSCFDSKTEKQIRAVMGITGDLFGSLTGISLDLEDLMDLAPSLAPYLEVPDLGIVSAETVLYADCSKNKIMEYCTTANNGASIPTGYLSDNSIVSFLMEYNISLPGLENLIAEAAIVKVTLSSGEVGYFPLINEGWGDWRIPMMDMMDSLG